jgi:Protein of unknown function (DUF2924)
VFRSSHMNQDLTEQLKQLHTLDKASLRNLWQELFERPAAGAPRREVMLPILAYRLQERAFGGLRPKARNELRKAAEDLTAEPRSKISSRRQLKPGTYLVREWQGKTHRVTVTAKGFEHDGTTFSSLSHVARHITGTQWSGPLFFGLRRTASGRKEANG